MTNTHLTNILVNHGIEYTVQDNEVYAIDVSFYGDLNKWGNTWVKVSLETIGVWLGY